MHLRTDTKMLFFKLEAAKAVYMHSDNLGELFWFCSCGRETYPEPCLKTFEY